jgi:hypothetical protein
MTKRELIHHVIVPSVSNALLTFMKSCWRMRIHQSLSVDSVGTAFASIMRTIFKGSYSMMDRMIQIETIKINSN